MLELRTFGGLSLSHDGVALDGLGLRKAEALLVYIAVEDRRHPRHALGALLWPESSPGHALSSLRVVLSALHRALPDCLDISRSAVGLRPGAQIVLDVARLEERLAHSQIEGALEVYRGDFLEGFHIHDSPAFEDWRLQEQERLRRLITDALHLSVSRALDQGDHEHAQRLTHRLLSLEPLDELAHRKHMQALALGGQRTAALAHYAACRKLLQEELGVEPAQETRELIEQIAQHDRPPGSPPVMPRHHLPIPLTSFVGREQELVEIQTLLQDPACRLLTLLGPGGIGKTRVALEAAAKNAEPFADGACFAPLGSVSSPEYLLPALADAVRFRFDTLATAAGPKIQLLDFLSTRSLLIVFDSFEHLLGGAGLVVEVLARAPRVKMLVTSRERLGLQGEWTLQVGGLPVPQGDAGPQAGGSSVLQLFVDRARQAKPDFRLSDAERAHAVRICEMVEGMPLGIELAAAWASTLSCEKIAEEIERNLDFLSTSLRDVPERHRSLRAAFDHSWRLLTEADRRIYRGLAVFRGGFDPGAAGAVAGADLSHLSTLLQKSLLRQTASGRFSMHGTLRQYAAEKLDELPVERDEVHARHARFYVDLLSQRQEDLMGRRMAEARGEIRGEMENVRAALNWAVVRWPPEEARRALLAFLVFYMVQGWHEGVDAFENIARLIQSRRPEEAIATAEADPLYLIARVLQAFFHSNLGQTRESEVLSQACLPALHRLGMTGELSVCLHNLGVNAAFRGEYDVARRRLEEAIALGRESGVAPWPSYFLWSGYVYFLLGEYERGLASFQQSYELFDRLGSAWGKAFALSKMGLAADGLKQYPKAMQHHREAFVIFEQHGDRAGKAYCLSRMSMGAYFLEDYAEAVRFGQEGHELFAEIGHRWGMCTSLCRLGFAFLGLGEGLQAKECFYRALEQSREHHMLPLSLHALAGLACSLGLEGQERRALELFTFVRRHPRTPALYVDMAARWVPRGDLELPKEWRLPAAAPGNSEAVDVVLDSVLSERKTQSARKR